MSSALCSDDLRRVFQSMDRNGDGVVCLDELNGVLEKISGVRFCVRELESVVGKAALNEDEFLCFYETILEEGEGRGSEEEEEEEEDELVEAFKVFDENGDGFISSEELERALVRLGMWERKERGDCESMICVYDLDSDGRLDFHEFKMMMTINKLP